MTIRLLLDLPYTLVGMSILIILEKIKVGPASFDEDYIEYIKSKLSPEFHAPFEELSAAMYEKDIRSIIESDPNNLRSEIEKRVIPFYQKFSAINEMLIRSSNNDFDSLAELDRNVFETINEYLHSSTNVNEATRTRILDIFQDLEEYDTMILDLAMHHPDNLKSAFDQIDSLELVRILSATVLSFSCMLVILKNEGQQSEKFQKLLEMSKEFSDKLSSYGDTIDILTNPNELQKITESLKHYSPSET